jgi:RNA polymerase sigma-70 factor (ECF subfamily)
MKITQEELIELHKTHYLSLLRYTRSIVKNYHSAEDIVQETYISLQKNQNYSKIKDHAVQWLFVVCRNGAFKALYKNKITNKVLVSGCLEKEDEEDSANPLKLIIDTANRSPVEKITKTEISAQNNRILNRALECLTPRQLQMINLRFFEERSYEEITKVADTSYTNVGCLLNCAKEKLRRRLIKYVGKITY